MKLRTFKVLTNLTADGIVGDLTFSKLINEIKGIQIALNHQGFNLIVDGVAGINTYNYLLSFQEANDLTMYGICFMLHS